MRSGQYDHRREPDARGGRAPGGPLGWVATGVDPRRDPPESCVAPVDLEGVRDRVDRALGGQPAAHARLARQYLDPVQARRGTATRAEVRRAVTYKTARYTVERPLHLGLAIGVGDAPLREALSDYALPLGEAFQLRDDLLGAFGDPRVTGKPFGEDLRERKQTYLLLRARERAGPAARRPLEEAVGQPGLRGDRLDEVCAVLVECGALADTERRIGELVAEALRALEAVGVVGTPRVALTALAWYATGRRW